jgi:tetratricopeptide (TPR) repeat protein
LHIAKKLFEEHRPNPSLVLQIAFCYYIGFGTARDETKSREILEQNNLSLQSLHDLVSQCAEERGTFKPSALGKLMDTGHVNWADSSYTYLDQRKLDEAETQLLREKDDLIMSFGEDHQLIIISIRLTIWICEIKRKWNTAEELEMQALDISERVLGSGNILTLASLYNLSLIYWEQGRWSEVEELLIQVLDIKKKTLGEQHPETLSNMTNLATLYRKQHRQEEAEKLEIQVLEARKKGTRRGAPQYAGKHEEPGLDILDPRQVGGVRKVRIAGGGNQQKGSRRESP